jgi:aminoglycoside phosphotransferase (APT) family kinase protein
MSPQGMSSRAIQAAADLARELNIGQVEPEVLHISEHVSIRLHPLDLVARMLPADGADAQARLRRELDVVGHLVRREAPVAAPAAALSPGPYYCDGFVLTLWQHVEHVAADPDNPAHVASAADALWRVHNALVDYPGPLPSWRKKFRQCHILLTDRRALSPLKSVDRAFLLMVHDQIMDRLNGLPVGSTPIHGDAGAHNVLITPGGALYVDFEDVCRGPREWDIGWLGDIQLGRFEPVSRDLLLLLADLRSLYVSVWCWARYDIAEKREAAEVHLGYLRARYT